MGQRLWWPSTKRHNLSPLWGHRSYSVCVCFYTGACLLFTKANQNRQNEVFSIPFYIPFLWVRKLKIANFQISTAKQQASNPRVFWLPSSFCFPGFLPEPGVTMLGPCFRCRSSAPLRPEQSETMRVWSSTMCINEMTKVTPSCSDSVFA